jgi:sensor c-di-GMP phosphodiesterase-like protein
MAEKEEAIRALWSTYDALKAGADKIKEGSNGPLRLQCKQIQDQIYKLTNSGAFDVTIKTPDLPKTVESWQLWKVILACTVAIPVGFVMLLVMWGLLRTNSPEYQRKEALRQQEQLIWEQAMAACENRNSNAIGAYTHCRNYLIANGVKNPYGN